MMLKKSFTAKNAKILLNNSSRTLRSLRLMVLLVVAASMLMNAQQVKGQGGIALENVGAAVAFGEQIAFNATIRTSVPIQSAAIVIFDEGHGVTQVQPLTIQSDGATQFIFDARQNVLKPFAYVRWHYEFTLADGSVIQSETYSVRYDDTRFSWQKLESNGLRVFWYAGDSTFAQNAMNAALAGTRAINEIFPIDLNQPIDIYILLTAKRSRLPRRRNVDGGSRERRARSCVGRHRAESRSKFANGSAHPARTHARAVVSSHRRGIQQPARVAARGTRNDG